MKVTETLFLLCLAFLIVSFSGCSEITLSTNESVFVENTTSIADEEDRYDSTRNTIYKASNNYIKLPSAIFFVDRQIGWSLCSKSVAICKTSDGGESWKIISSLNGQTIKALYFTDSKTGFAIVDLWNTDRRSNKVLKTVDGGTTWSLALEISSPITNISFWGKQKGIILARWTDAYLSEDGGKHWEAISLTAKEEEIAHLASSSVNFVAWVDENKAWGFGNGIWLSVDGSRSWTKVTEGTSGGFLDASFVDNIGWIVGHNNQLWKLDDNDSWKNIDIPRFAGNFDLLHRVDFINSDVGWVILSHSEVRDSPLGKLIHTNDGGKTWKVINESINTLQEIYFVNADNGFGLNSSGDLVFTQDGGITWELQSIY